MDDKNFNDDKYTLPSQSNTSLVDFGLYATARKTPLSITYYGYCLENGNYTVRLHFAELEFTDEKLYNKVARRVFDIYIQVINFCYIRMFRYITCSFSASHLKLTEFKEF